MPFKFPCGRCSKCGAENLSVTTIRDDPESPRVCQQCLEPGALAPVPSQNVPRELNLSDLAATDPARPKMLLPTMGAFPLGEPTLLAGDGGTGKSNVALNLAVCVATGAPFFGEPIERRRVAYLSFEDPEPVIHWRLARACYAANVAMADLLPSMKIFDGTTCPGSWYARGEHGAYGFTLDFEAIKVRLKQAEFIVVDGAADVFAGNENDRSNVKAFVRGLRTLVPPDGSLLLLAHVDKAGVQQGGDGLGYSGSTGWNNSVRSRLFMYRETIAEDHGKAETGNVALEVRKSNYGKKGARMLLRYDTEYDIFRRVDAPGEKAKPRDADETQAIVDGIRAAYKAGVPIPASTAGTRTAHSVSEAREGFPDSLKGQRGRKRFYRHLEQLRASGRVITESVRTNSRKHLEVLNVPALS